VHDLVVVEVVVPDLDAGFFLEVLERVFGDVVRPVVDVQNLLFFLGCRRPGLE
jgi:hypothetical protein